MKNYQCLTIEKIDDQTVYATLFTTFDNGKENFEIIENLEQISEIFEFLKQCGALISTPEVNPYNPRLTSIRIIWMAH